MTVFERVGLDVVVTGLRLVGGGTRPTGLIPDGVLAVSALTSID